MHLEGGTKLETSTFPSKGMTSQVTVIEEAKDLATMSMKEFITSLITHEYTSQMDKEEVENNKKKDLAGATLMKKWFLYPIHNR